MNVATIEVDQEKAKEALKEYRTEVRKTHHRLDQQILRGYRAIARGKKLINLPEVLKAGGVNENGYPKLAVARANRVGRDVGVDLSRDGSGFFYDSPMWNWRVTRSHTVTPSRVYFPIGTFPEDRTRNNVVTPVPMIPPAHRPSRGLENYHILFEVKRWTRTVAADPALIRYLGGDLWVLVSTWELTELERAVLANY